MITGELVGFFTHHAAQRKVPQNAVEQPRLFQQLQRRLAFAFIDDDLLLLRLQRFADLFVLQLLQLQQHAPQIAFDDFFFDGHLDGGLLDEHGALAGRVQIERIDVEPFPSRGQQIHLQQLVAHVLGQSADAVAAVPQRHDDFLANASRWARPPPAARRLKKQQRHSSFL